MINFLEIDNAETVEFVWGTQIGGLCCWVKLVHALMEVPPAIIFKLVVHTQFKACNWLKGVTDEYKNRNVGI